MISVICATWNRADTLHIPIESMLNQTYKNWELIISDDGSTDNTEEVVRGYDDIRIKYIKHEKTPYYTINRNIGIENSKGELLAFLDSDSGRDPMFLEYMAAPHRNKDIALTYCGRIVYENVDLSKLKYKDIKDLEGKEKYPPIFTGADSLTNIVDVGDIMIKRSVFNDEFKGFSEEKDLPGYCSDAKLVDDIIKYNPKMRIVRIPKLLHYYFLKHDSKTENMTLTKLKDREKGELGDLERKWDF